MKKKEIEEYIKSKSVTQDNYVAPTVQRHVDNRAPTMVAVSQTVKPATQNKPNVLKTIGKTLVNIPTNLGIGAIKTMESVADTVSDLVTNPLESKINYAYDYFTKGKKTADENAADLIKMQQRDIKKDRTENFLNKVGYNDVVDELEKDSLVKRNNFGGQVAQGIGGMVPSLVVGGALGGSAPTESLKGLSGKEFLKTAGKNVLTTYQNQLPANAILGASSYGSGVEEALNEGAPINKARLHGLANLAIEQGTEMITGGVPGLEGKGGLDQFVDPLLDRTKGLANPLLKAGYRALGEGAEEYAGAWLEPLAKKIYSDEKIDWNEVRKNARQAGLVGAATGAVLDAPQFVNELTQTSQQNKQTKSVKKAKEESSVEKLKEQITPTEIQEAKIEENASKEEQVAKVQEKPKKKGIDYSQEKYKDFTDSDKETMNKLYEKYKNKEAFTKEEQLQSDYLNRKTKGLKNPELKTNNTMEDLKSDYGKYYKNNNLDNFDSTMLNKAETIVEANKQGKRTKQQWLDIAENIGMQAENLDSESLKRYAFESFKAAAPNQTENLNRQGKKYVGFGIDEWVNKVYEGAKVGTKVENIAAEMSKEPVIQSKEYKEAKEKIADGTATEKERSYINTATEAQNTEELIKDMDEVAKNYEVVSNEKSLKQAEAKLKNKTLEEKSSYVNDLLNSGKRLDSSDVAAAELVLKDAAATKNAKVYNEVLENISIYATEAGQNIQALSMIKRLSPSSQLDVLEKIINREKAKGNKIYQNVEITEEMKNRIFDCYDENGNINQEQFDNTMEEIKQEIADEMPATASEKIRAWRYLSMLGNPKTHVRNELANVAMTVVKLAKDTVNATGQDLFIKDKANKTATLKSSSKEVKNLADFIYEQTYTKQENSKYNEQSDLENRREIFKIKPLEKARKFNEKMLSAEDQFFKKINFKKAFSNYLTAQGISTQADIESHPEIIQRAKNFAIEEANVATFNQRNKLSEFINSADNKLGTTGKVIRGAIIPFTRTPLNIAKTGIEYTPGTGLLTTISDVKNAPKNMKGTVLIDGLSKQITGSSLALLGYALAKSGIVTSNGDDDKEDYFRIDQGNKMDYSIKIGDNSYDLSWMSPSSMPFFVGARMFEVLDKQEGLNENLILESLASTLDPLSEMSVISSFTDILSSYGNSSTGKIKDMAISTGQNYLSQFIPTVSGQFARLFDDTKRTTTADKNATNKISQETYRQLAYKIPGLRNTLPASTDYYGQPKKEQEDALLRAIDAFINPANTKKDNLSDESKEILEVFEKTGNADIIPTSSLQYITFNNQRYEMTRKEYNAYKKDFGDTFNKNIKKLFSSRDYQNATDDEKAKMIKKILDYSKDKAKDNFLTERGVDYTTRTKTGKISYKESRKVDNKVGEYGIVDYYIENVLKESD